MARKNTAAQEKFISGLTTAGALDSGSGFDANFGRGESNDAYAARLEAWKGNKGGGSGAGGGGGGVTGGAAAAGLAAASPDAKASVAQAQSTIGTSEMGGPVELPAINALRSGLGTRIYPQATMALAGLGRAY